MVGKGENREKLYYTSSIMLEAGHKGTKVSEAGIPDFSDFQRKLISLLFCARVKEEAFLPSLLQT